MSVRPASAALALLLLSTALAGCTEPPVEVSPFHGIEEVPPVPLEGIELVDSNGSTWSLDLMRGDVLVVAFVFTRCPDVCLATEANMVTIANQYEDNHSDLVFLSIALDPWTDTAEDMDGFAERYGAEWLHLTGVGAGEQGKAYLDLERAWTQFGIGLNSINQNDTYTIDHSSPIILVDKDLNRRVAWMQDDFVIDQIVADIDYLLAE